MYISKRLLIIHYHFKKGGVTDVIAAAVKAFDRYKSVEHVTLSCGDTQEEGREIISSIKALESISLDIEHVPALGYCNDSSDVEDCVAHAHRYATLERFFTAHTDTQTLWWVHNHHLGKNPVFTKVLMKHLHSSGQCCILHMHDFPEAARFANLTAIEKLMPHSKCYASMAGTQYAVINSVDASILRSGGLEAHYVPNIVSQNNDKPAQAVHPQGLETHAFLYAISPQFAHKPEQALLFTYPVRCIRRKNILEAAFITKLYEGYTHRPCNYNITLRGESEQEKPYSQAVESLFEEGVIHGFFWAWHALSKQPKSC